MSKALESSLLTLDSPRQSIVSKLSDDLTRSLRRPGRRTLTLLDRALTCLRPFESPKARTASQAERRELVSLLTLHRNIFTPYLDVDRIESNLRYGAQK